ncbi:MAG: hypothetical protein F2942_04625 [Actinobacteria bacterium]|nr:hypothetical protein [Actinomycetota bacterium]MSY22252.1 hypothetical protein [Actinomycetota bacterium]MTA73983.1 hypothetical protein [Actinomycetota bacterium]
MSQTTAAITVGLTTVATIQVHPIRVPHLPPLTMQMTTMEVTVTAAKTAKRIQLIPKRRQAIATPTLVTRAPVLTTSARPLLTSVLLTTLLLASLLTTAASCGEQDSVLGPSQSVVWPPADGSVTYADPVEAATGFAVEFVGFSNPLVGEFQQGDARSGEVAIRPTATGPITTVLLRQLEGDDSWSVLGAGTDAIVPTAPAAGSVVQSPVTLQGTSTASEGTVDVAVRSQAKAPPLATGFVTGGSMGQMGPFKNTLEFAKSATPEGAIVFSTSSMEDGRVWEATVVSVRFG